MKDICQYELCTGCSACQNICPHDCITMEPDSFGVLHPTINEHLCVDCGLCSKTCPINVPVELFDPHKCYAVWHRDYGFRKKCASGGVAASLYLFFIQKLKGVVYGVTWDSHLRPIFCRTENLNVAVQFKGSKYVQAFVEDIYRQVKRDLRSNRFVLFIGTPCQVAGLKNYLKQDYDRLFTCDLVCHGVPPYEYFHREIDRIKRHKRIQVTGCRFRGNDEYNYHLTLWDGEKLVYDRRGSQSYFLYGFLTSITLSEGCYSCKFATDKRVGDISIGDFIGLGNLNIMGLQPKNVSVVTINTKRACSLWEQVQNSDPSIMQEERLFSEAVTGGQSFQRPAVKNVKRDKFLKDYKLYGWDKAIHRALWKSILRNKIKRI
ncbi:MULTISPECIES: Coenzyme F420 hydrogenase/dehydrogenase, beta subunit C-terminal domain [unclassified Barnesiella]|uniref:Coenzyme F420 hydrogenase/dehydrogenase, beta subunit C-terminal domain n=1 Tax=unclassified Barnesiella TaxID=2645177 RepID=UPI000B370AB7|nr:MULTISPECIES: Coenzyme F420 hydrogenase/dehydrogenase, beta subunit C-terminal domain [unclassified Barnesiella]MCR8912777.1 Coenzyme F420 hydrogenase/dehydrogenase, beta subunit C-terminal domain [Barnesiella sp. ET7]OUO96722.1 hypothetical protein B5F38_12495 [Barnesiella sp. An22]